MISFTSSIKYIKKTGVLSFVWSVIKSSGGIYVPGLSLFLSIKDYLIGPLDITDILKTYCVIAFCVLLLFVLIWKWPKKLISKYKSQQGVTVIIECCDLLTQKGLKIIHTNTTFETDSNIVFKRSLHGQFLTYCKNKGIDVSNMVRNSIEQKKLKKTSNGFFPLGTILNFVPAQKEQDKENPLKDFRFVAFADYIDGKDLAVDSRTYRELLSNMWRNLSYANNKRSVVNVAVMGNQFVSFPDSYTIEHKVDIIIQEFYKVSKKRKVCDTLRICIHPSDADDFGFNNYDKIIQHIANSPDEEINK